MSKEIDYFADRVGDCVVAIHVSEKGLEDLYYAFPATDQFARDLWALLERVRRARGDEEAESA